MKSRSPNPAATKARAAWDRLNDRQRAYLTVIYEADQDAEAEIAAARKRWEKTPPASEWRWLLYEVEGPGNHSSIQATLKRQGKLDPGAGSTLAVLRKAALIIDKSDIWSTGLGSAVVQLVQLTQLGRAVARAGLDEPPPIRVPEGLLSAWLWNALTRLYLAGDTGCLYDSGAWGLPKDSPERAPSWNALLELRNRRDGAFMEEFTARPAGGGVEYRVRITDRGRRHVEIHRRCYADLYVDGPWIEPVMVDGAHAGLTDHGQRPRHLVTVTEWRLLVWLTRLEWQGRSPEREHIVREYAQFDDEVPTAVLAIPDGQVSLYSAERCAGSAAAVARLRDRKGGGLVEVVEAPNLYRFPGESKTLRRVRLTEAGRRHVAEHGDDYARWYPDVDGPTA